MWVIVFCAWYRLLCVLASCSSSPLSHFCIFPIISIFFIMWRWFLLGNQSAIAPISERVISRCVRPLSPILLFSIYLFLFLSISSPPPTPLFFLTPIVSIFSRRCNRFTCMNERCMNARFFYPWTAARRLSLDVSIPHCSWTSFTHGLCMFFPL